MASQKQLEGTEITRKGDPIPRSLHPHLQWWLKENNVLTEYKRRWGVHLNIPRPLLREDNTCSTDNTTVVSYINKEGSMRSGSLCALQWRILTWCTRKQVTQSLTYSRLAERGSRQAIQAKPDHPNGVVSPSRGLPNNIQQVAPAQNRPICHEVQQQVASVCVTGTRSPGHSSGCTRSAMGGIWMHTPSHQQPCWAKWWRSCRTPHARESF